MLLFRRVLLPAVAALALVAAPLPSSAKHGVGVVTDGHYRCYKGYLDLAFDFVGRMPAGNNFYTVTSGHAVQTGAFCYGFGLSMTGDTPSGTFHWTCGGNWSEVQADLLPTYLFNGWCVTAGFTGSFRFQAVLQAVEDLGTSGYGPWYGIKGVIHAGTGLV